MERGGQWESCRLTFHSPLRYSASFSSFSLFFKKLFNFSAKLTIPYTIWKATQRYQEQQQCITGEPDTWKLVSPVRRGDVEKGQFRHLVSVLLYHFAHREHNDNRHSPQDVRHGALARTLPAPTLARIFFASEFTRRLDRSGYIRFRRWRFYAEEGLARQQVQVSFYTSTLKIEYEEDHLTDRAYLPTESLI